jgi:hypothetical protein
MPGETTGKLIFIYNADSGVKNGLFDIAHKIFNPDTYQCHLCELTFGAFRERSIWKKFRSAHDTSMEFIHKDEFLKVYASKFLPAYSYPLILEETASDLTIFMGTEEINAISGTKELIKAIEQRMQGLSWGNTVDR